MSSRSLIIAFALVLVAAVPSAFAADASSVDSHVRTNERPLALLLKQAEADSPYFRHLVERLNESDVIVYVRSERKLPSFVDGRLTFLGGAAGRRYVVVSLAWGRPDMRVIATLAHELQHALEVAARPDVVDSGSLGRAYEEIGYEASPWNAGRAYDTHAALAAGERVWQEIARRSGEIADRATILEPRP